jgi:hypothetical protein
MLALCEYNLGMSKDLPPSRTAEQFVVRFPEGMRDRIAEAAKKNNRSMNAEIVARLSQSLSSVSVSVSEGDDGVAIPEMVWDFVEDEASAQGISESEALEQLMYRGIADGDPVVVINIAPGMTIADMRLVFEVGEKYLNAQSFIVANMSLSRVPSRAEIVQIAKEKLAHYKDIPPPTPPRLPKDDEVVMLPPRGSDLPPLYLKKGEKPPPEYSAKGSQRPVPKVRRKKQ